MANIKTRLKLRYDSLEMWASKNPTLLDGEVAIAYLPPKGTGDAPAATSTAVLMKVGPGAFNSLPFTSALAADVYAWAKEAKLTINKDGTGNVVSGIEWDANANGGKGGIKFTTAAVATAEGLDELQKDVAALEKDIADNRAAWAKDDNTTYTFAKSTDGKGITITPSEGSANTITFAFLTKEEIEALNYLVAADITTGSANGTIAVEGEDVAVKGLQDAAYTTVASLNATAKGYADDVQNSLGDLATKDSITASLVDDFATEVAKVKVANATHADAAGKVDKALTIKVGKTDVVFDGSAEKTADVDTAISNAIGTRTNYTNTEIDNKVGAVLGTSADAATANTVYGAKAAAAAAQGDASEALNKINGFLTGVGDSTAVIDTLVEIQKFMTDDTGEFVQLSEQVADITKDNGTIDTKVKAAIDAEVTRANGAYEPIGAEGRAITAAKSETQTQITALTTNTINPLANRVKAIEDAPYATETQVNAKLNANGWTDNSTKDGWAYSGSYQTGTYNTDLRGRSMSLSSKDNVNGDSVTNFNAENIQLTNTIDNNEVFSDLVAGGVFFGQTQSDVEIQAGFSVEGASLSKTEYGYASSAALNLNDITFGNEEYGESTTYGIDSIQYNLPSGRNNGHVANGTLLFPDLGGVTNTGIIATTADIITAVEAVAKDAADQATVVLSEAQKYADEKVGALTTDDIAPGSNIWIFDCGSATEVI